jgi:hypothetical protein
MQQKLTLKRQYLISGQFSRMNKNFLILESKTLFFNPDCYFKSDADEYIREKEPGKRIIS